MRLAIRWAIALLLVLPAPLQAMTTVATFADAFITHDDVTDVWTIGSRAVGISFGFDQGRQWQLWQIILPDSGKRWPIARGADSSLTIGSVPTTLSTMATGLTFVAVSATATATGVQLEVEYARTDIGARIRRSYACYPGSPVVETWTRVEVTGTRAVAIGDIVTWRASVAPGVARWLNGLRGDSADVHADDAFSAQMKDLAPGDDLVLGSARRSSEQQVPVAILDAADALGEQFVVGSMWSGPWRMTLSRGTDRIGASVAYPDVVTSAAAGQPFESPHAFFGVVAGDAVGVPVALRAFVDNGLRPGRPMAPLVTYNTWFTYGVQMDADALLGEIDRSAELGVELFVVDAGWYATPGATDKFDFEAGLGGWDADPARFPNGLRPLRDRAHAKGMKFGLWVEPERLNQAMLDRADGVNPQWLATADAAFGSPKTAQICLGGRAARDWLLKHLAALIDDVQPDYLKWDNNFWIGCNSAAHDHGIGDGAFAHVHGLYDILDALRTRYPQLLIENVSGGGNRLDFGWLRYSDAAWMDDRTSPSSHVRHNFEGLATIFPPGYLLAFALDAQHESIFDGADVPLYLRSRTPGILGLTFHGQTLPGDTSRAISDAVTLYKDIRAVTPGGDAMLLSAPADVADAARWDAVEEMDSATGNAVVFAFRGDTADARTTVRPRGLRPDATYEVRSADAGLIGTALGGDLMRDGVELIDGGASRAHILTLLTSPVATSNRR